MSTNLKSQRTPLEDWISQAEAARVRGISRQAIGRLIQRKRLRILVVGGTKFVSRSEVISFMPAQVGRKPAK